MEKSPDAFRTISEVADLLETPAHVLRFWESRFPQIKPVKRAGGRRYYRPADVALLSGIRRLLHDDGMTIRGVQKILREQGVRHVAGLTGGVAALTEAGGDDLRAGVVLDAPATPRAPAEVLVLATRAPARATPPARMAPPRPDAPLLPGFDLAMSGGGGGTGVSDDDTGMTSLFADDPHPAAPNPTDLGAPQAAGPQEDDAQDWAQTWASGDIAQAFDTDPDADFQPEDDLTAPRIEAADLALPQGHGDAAAGLSDSQPGPATQPCPALPDPRPEPAAPLGPPLAERLCQRRGGARLPDAGLALLARARALRARIGAPAQAGGQG